MTTAAASTALSEALILPPDEVVSLLSARLATLDKANAGHQADLRLWSERLPRVLLIESEYALAMRHAQAEWLRGLIGELTAGTLSGMDAWRHIHATGEMPCRVRRARRARAKGVDRDSGRAVTANDPGPRRCNTANRDRKPHHQFPQAETRRISRPNHASYAGCLLTGLDDAVPSHQQRGADQACTRSRHTTSSRPTRKTCARSTAVDHRRPRRDLRPARPERRRQVHHDQDPHHPGPARLGHRRVAGHDVLAEPARVRRVIGVVSPALRRRPGGHRPGEPAAAGPPVRADRRDLRGAWTSCSTGSPSPSPPTGP